VSFGIVLVGQALPGEDAALRLTQVGVPYYYDYTATLAAPPGFLKLPMLRVGRDNATDPSILPQLARAYPGRSWLLGNEPDQPDQDGGRSWDETARLTYQYVRAIKDADPTATTVGPNMLSTSLEHLAHFRDVPFDIIGVHVYVAPDDLEHALDGWPRPMWVTEFGAAAADPVGYVRRAIQAFRAAGARKWFLFASDPIPQAWGRSSGNWITTHARDGNGGLSPVGSVYRDLAEIDRLRVELMLGRSNA
jgi:hypothetical protein